MERIEKLKIAFTKSYNYEMKNLYALTYDMSPKELEIVFQNEKAFKRMLKTIKKNKNTLLEFFKILPASIQEKMWDIDEIRLLLMGITDLSWQIKNHYFPEYMIDRIRELTKAIKSEVINQSLADDVCFQAIILFGKDINPCILKHVDIERLMIKTSESFFYDKVSINKKKDWVIFLNTLVEKICLPRFYQELYGNENTLLAQNMRSSSFAHLINVKRWHLKDQGKIIVIDENILDKITDNELAVIYNLVCSDSEVEEESLITAKLNEKITKKIQEENIFTPKYFNLAYIDTNYVYLIFKVVNEKIKEDKKLEEEYLKFMSDYLFGDQIDEEYREQINVYIKNDLVGRSKEDLAKLFYNKNYIKSLFHMRFGVTAVHMNYIEKFDKNLIMKLNVKQVNKIVKILLEKEKTDEISDIYAKAINMYLVFGLDKSISLLNGKYGLLYKNFFDSLSKVNVDNVSFEIVGKKYEPKPNKDFLDFVFAGNNIYKLLENDSTIGERWYYLYNNLDSLRQMCRGHLSMKQVEEILSNLKVNYPLTPDLYRLKDILYEVSLGNRSGSDEKVYEETVKIYEKQIDRKESSIPYVVGFTEQGYKYEVMRMDDPLIYTLGYKEKCCFRVLDIGHKHLEYAALCKNGRVLLTYKPDGKLASFSPLKRNGELLIANSIEVLKDDANDNVTAAFMAGIQAIMAKTKNKEDNYLKVACIGDNVANLCPNGFPWPEEIETPTILEKNDSRFVDTDSYHKKLKVIAVVDGTKLDSLKYGEVKINYEDPRPKIRMVELKPDVTSGEMELINVINAIKYKNSKINGQRYYGDYNLSNIKYGFYNDDWFILVDKNDKLYSENIEGSEEALKEMKATLTVLSEKVQKNNIDEYILSFKKKDEI